MVLKISLDLYYPTTFCQAQTNNGQWTWYFSINTSNKYDMNETGADHLRQDNWEQSVCS